MTRRGRDDWGGRRATEAKATCQQLYGWVCWLCGHPIEDPDDYTVDHVKERVTHPHLTWEPSNWRPAHGRKHPELGCPGNFGRSGRRADRPRMWIAEGW
jgi:5-methylcytosine-specific restriction endonuclease McrA